MTILWGFFSVFPANAGMILTTVFSDKPYISVPRECGDDPCVALQYILQKMCSPRMRG